MIRLIKKWIKVLRYRIYMARYVPPPPSCLLCYKRDCEVYPIDGTQIEFCEDCAKEYYRRRNLPVKKPRPCLLCDEVEGRRYELIKDTGLIACYNCYCLFNDYPGRNIYIQLRQYQKLGLLEPRPQSEE